MSAAEDIHAGYPEPYTGRSTPPETVKADNDDAVAVALGKLVEAIGGFRDIAVNRVMVGQVELLLPPGKPVLTPARLRLLGRAWIAADEKRVGAIELNVEKLEAMCWPSGIRPREIWPADRELKITTPGRRRSEERKRVVESERAKAPAQVPQSVFDKMAEARKHLAKAEMLKASDPRKNRKAIKDHLTSAKLLQNEARDLQRQAADDDWSFRADRETAELATARGETVEKTKQGRTRIMTRAGIQHSYEAGYMEPRSGQRMKAADLYETAKRYRDAYEIITGRTTPSGSGGSGFGGAPQVRIVEAGEQLATMRLGLTRAELEVLDRVCGQEMRVREAATILGRAFNASRDALRDGLTSATINIRAAKAVKDTGEKLTRFRLEDAHAQIEAAMRAIA